MVVITYLTWWLKCVMRPQLCLDATLGQLCCRAFVWGFNFRCYKNKMILSHMHIISRTLLMLTWFASVFTKA